MKRKKKPPLLSPETLDMLFDERAFSGKLARVRFLFHELLILRYLQHVQFVINANDIVDAHPTTNVRTRAKSRSRSISRKFNHVRLTGLTLNYQLILVTQETRINQEKNETSKGYILLQLYLFCLEIKRREREREREVLIFSEIETRLSVSRSFAWRVKSDIPHRSKVIRFDASIVAEIRGLKFSDNSLLRSANYRKHCR